MIKKVSIMAIMFVTLVIILGSFMSVMAVTGEEVLNSEQATELVKIKI